MPGTTTVILGSVGLHHVARNFEQSTSQSAGRFYAVSHVVAATAFSDSRSQAWRQAPLAAPRKCYERTSAARQLSQ